jgi:hypothetical protein
MQIKLKTIIESDRALARLLSAHGPTAADTYKLSKLRRAVIEHIGPESAYAEARNAAEARYTVTGDGGRREFMGADDRARLAAAEAFAAEIKALLDDTIELHFTPLTLAQLDVLKVADEKPLALGADEMDALAWLLEEPKP